MEGIIDMSAGGAPPSNPNAPKVVVNPITTEKGEGREISIVISGPIREEANFFSVVETIENATEKDVIRLVINTVGGSVASGALIINALMRTPAHTITVAEGMVYSCGTFLWMVGKEPVVGDWCDFMFHQTRNTLAGKSADTHAASQGNIAYSKTVAKYAVKRGLLTDDEYVRMFDENSDVYVTAEMMQGRVSSIGGDI